MTTFQQNPLEAFSALLDDDAAAATDAEDDAWVILLFNKKLKMQKFGIAILKLKKAAIH